ncbi:MAG: putative transposase [Gammaproteobacteria bacterium]|jgi:putative transposase
MAPGYSSIFGKRALILPVIYTRAVAKSFFKTLKVERVYRQTYPSRDHARIDTVNWMEGFYNRHRLHSSIGFVSPVDAEARLMAA